MWLEGGCEKGHIEFKKMKYIHDQLTSSMGSQQQILVDAQMLGREHSGPFEQATLSITQVPPPPVLVLPLQEEYNGLLGSLPLWVSTMSRGIWKDNLARGWGGGQHPTILPAFKA